MPLTCTICKSKRRKAIDEELIRGVTLRNIAKKYRVGYVSLFRHKKKCLPAKLALIKQQEVVDAKTLLAEMKSLKLCLQGVFEAALKSNNAAAIFAGAR